ncbi:MAG: potassium channel family protein, partial [Pseudomonadota bacterium]
YFEKWTKFDGLYWSLITATTVGYGDIRPLKKLSRVLSIFIALIGILFTGIIIAAAVKAVSVSLEKNLNPTVIEKIKEDIEN